jgi:hypothetical protein
MMLCLRSLQDHIVQFRACWINLEKIYSRVVIK